MNRRIERLPSWTAIFQGSPSDGVAVSPARLNIFHTGAFCLPVTWDPWTTENAICSPTCSAVGWSGVVYFLGVVRLQSGPPECQRCSAVPRRGRGEGQHTLGL